MKLILEVYQTDGCTYGYDTYHAFECENKEKAEIELFELYEQTRINNEKGDYEPNIKFRGHELYWGAFYDRSEEIAKKSGRIKNVTWTYSEPKFYTPDELWEKLKA